MVLKTFDRLGQKTIQRAILNEIVVPFVVDSEVVLKPSDFFIEDEVRRGDGMGLGLFVCFYIGVGVSLIFILRR